MTTIFDGGLSRAESDSNKWRKYAGRDILPAWVADMDCAAAPPILAAMRERLEHGVFGYAEPPQQLLETTCDYFLRRWKWKISPEWIVCLPGLGAAIHNVCRMAEGGDILTPSPIYHVFRNAPAIAGAARIDLPMHFDSDSGEWQLPMEVLESRRTSRARVLQLCNPHNPNGKIYTRAELLALGEFCRRHNLILCADEVHADLILDEGGEHLCAAALDESIADVAITLQSPSKAFNIAGLNFAVAVIANADLRRRFCEALRGKCISHFNSFGMAAAAAAWGGDCDEWLARAIAELRANRDFLSAEIEKTAAFSMPPLPATYLAWLRLEKNLSPEDCERGGVGMSSGASFGDANYMRLNFGCHPDTLSEIAARLRKM